MHIHLRNTTDKISMLNIFNAFCRKTNRPISSCSIHVTVKIGRHKPSHWLSRKSEGSDREREEIVPWEIYFLSLLSPLLLFVHFVFWGARSFVERKWHLAKKTWRCTTDTKAELWGTTEKKTTMKLACLFFEEIKWKARSNWAIGAAAF